MPPFWGARGANPSKQILKLHIISSLGFVWNLDSTRHWNSKFRMLIYNKWGQLIFESNSQDYGWDGYYKNRLAPTGVYVYKLELRYSDGRDVVKIGDLTLLR